MYGNEVAIEKILNVEFPHIFFLKDNKVGYVDSEGSLSGNCPDEILKSKHTLLEISNHLLDNDYELFVSIDMLGDDLKAEIDESDFKKSKISTTNNEVEFFSQWNEKYLDENVYKVCDNNCEACCYCIDSDFKYIIAYPGTAEEYRGDILPESADIFEKARVDYRLEYMEKHTDEEVFDFEEYDRGAYGVFVKQIDGKNLADCGYVERAVGPVGPVLEFYHIDDFKGEVKEALIKLVDDLI